MFSQIRCSSTQALKVRFQIQSSPLLFPLFNWSPSSIVSTSKMVFSVVALPFHLICYCLIQYSGPLRTCRGLVVAPGPRQNTKLHGCSRILYKMTQYLHTTYTHPHIYFKSFLDYLYLIQYKCYVSSCKYKVKLCKLLLANSRFAF